MPRCVFFLNAPATAEIYTLSLHDALPIFLSGDRGALDELLERCAEEDVRARDIPAAIASHSAYVEGDRKSTRLNSSHSQISYAVFCLKKKNQERDAREGQQHVHQRQAHVP